MVDNHEYAEVVTDDVAENDYYGGGRSDEVTDNDYYEAPQAKSSLDPAWLAGQQ